MNAVTWKLKRTRQCKNCPWKIGIDPLDIPNGYCEVRHKSLRSTIAVEGDISAVYNPEIKVMACHETDDTYCIGWLVNQLGIGNNIALRLKMMTCDNSDQIALVGQQYQKFQDTLP